MTAAITFAYAVYETVSTADSVEVYACAWTGAADTDNGTALGARWAAAAAKEETGADWTYLAAFILAMVAAITEADAEADLDFSAWIIGWAAAFAADAKIYLASDGSLIPTTLSTV